MDLFSPAVGLWRGMLGLYKKPIKTPVQSRNATLESGIFPFYQSNIDRPGAEGDSMLRISRNNTLVRNTG